ncbi:MAG TPA: CaiB/BaiF CoA-transferase family protein [Steroidobacteraceae bacterium]|nr:CaiB/BaiF CoA-transferase family protein [Steroidobacteraceae bacterium]
MPPSPRPLDGLLAVSIEQAVAAPLCTLRLADAGARVIKIERPEGETARHYDTSVHGMSAYFVWLNRGKESVALDLKSEADAALLHRLLARADIFVQNLAPGAVARLGLAQLSARLPGLIVVNIVGYGQDSAYADMRAYDMLVQAESGLCAVTGTPDTPSKVGVSAADIATGMNAYEAILEAVLSRQKSGRGAEIEIAMFDAMADWMAVPLLHYQYAGQLTGRHGLAHASIYPYRAYGCHDGRSVIIAVQQNSEWQRFCVTVLNRADLLSDQRFATNPGRVQHRQALDAILEPFFAQLQASEVVRRLTAAQVAWGEFRELSSLSEHPALHAMQVALPDGQRVAVPRPAGRPALQESIRMIPALGADTDRIRAEFAA